MDPISRRTFVESLGTTAAAGWVMPSLPGLSASPERVVRMTGAGVRLGDGGAGRFTLAVNETWIRRSAADLAQAFEQSVT